MTNIDNEKQYLSLSESIKFILAQFKKSLNVSIPGVVNSYDDTTKRCSVLPAIRAQLTTNEFVSLPLLTNIPVLFPSGGGILLTFPIKKGDSVLLVFSQRGLSNFKKDLKESYPTSSILDLHDAVAIPGFGDLTITSVDTDAATLQTSDATSYISLKDSSIKSVIGSNSFVLDSSSFKATIGGATLSLSSSELVSSVPISAPSLDLTGGDISNAGNINTTSGVNLTTHVHTDPQGGITGGPQ